MPQRVIIVKPIQGKAYAVGKAVILPDHTAEIYLKRGIARVPSPEDFAREQKQHEADAKARTEAKAKAKAEAKKHAAEIAAARPIVDAQDKVASVKARLVQAERRHSEAPRKKRKQWKATVDALKAELADAQAELAKADGSAKPEPEPEPEPQPGE